MNMWKLVGALAVVATLASAAFASAAMLNVTSQGLQAGGTDIRGCQGAAPVNIAYTTVYDPPTGTFRVDTVTASGINPACITAAAPTTLDVVLTFAGPPATSQDLGTVTIIAISHTYTIPVALRPDAAKLTDVHVLIK